MKSSFAIDTGDERHVVGHFVSGAVAGGIASSTLNYNRLKNEEITKPEFATKTVKIAMQSGIGTAAAISAANNMGKGNWVNVFTSIGLGALGIYATDKFYGAIDNKDTKKEIQEKAK